MSGRRRPTGFDFEAAGEPSLEEVADEIYGPPREALDTGRLVARPIPLEMIWPDIRQPRRAVPPTVRGQWTGDPEDIPAVLTSWWQAAGGESITRFLARATEAPDYAPGDPHPQGEAIPEADPIRDEWYALLKLAASIDKETLQNPITVVKRNGGFLVETGERRLLAYHVLRVNLDARKYNAIPCIVKDQPDVWGQAAENGTRRPLNAISMARQLALLIMDLYAEFSDTFGKFEDVVLPGECDRVWYAQVADGSKWPLPSQHMQRVLDVTGLRSKSQVSQYRRLLTISDDWWMQADNENWSEFALRQKLQEAKEATARLTPLNPQVSADDEGSGGGVNDETPPPGPLSASRDGEQSTAESEDPWRKEARKLALIYMKDTRSGVTALCRMGFGATHGRDGSVQFTKDGTVVVSLRALPEGVDFRFDAYELLEWKLANQTPPPGPLPAAQRGGDAAVEQKLSAGEKVEHEIKKQHEQLLRDPFIDELVRDPDSYPHEGYQEETTPVVASYPAAVEILRTMEIVRGMVHGGNQALFEAVEVLSSWTEDDVIRITGEIGAESFHNQLQLFHNFILAGFDMQRQQIVMLLDGILDIAMQVK